MAEVEEDIAIRHALSAPDYYRLLLVSQDANEDAIKRVYLRLSRKLHPDKAQTASRHRAEAAVEVGVGLEIAGVRSNHASLL